jgi:hypothetical protein
MRKPVLTLISTVILAGSIGAPVALGTHRADLRHTDAAVGRGQRVSVQPGDRGHVAPRKRRCNPALPCGQGHGGHGAIAAAARKR